MAESRGERPTGADDRPSGESSATTPIQTSLLVAVCTYRRAELLRSLLRELARQHASVSWRVLVIDNDPAGSAEAVTLSTDLASAARVDYLAVTTGHIVAARNAAMEHARSDECVVFIDDDETPSPEWLSALEQAHRASPDAVVVGPVRPRIEGPPPAWAPDLWYFLRPEYPDGASVEMAGVGNALLPPHLHAALGLRFNPDFDGIGAEDTELFTRWKAAGGSLVWAADAVVHELVTEGRTAVHYPFDRARAGAYGYCRVHVRGPGTWLERTVTVPVRAIQGAVLVGAGWVTRDPVRRARGLVRAGQAWGTLQGIVGYRPPTARKRPGVDDLSP